MRSEPVSEDGRCRVDEVIGTVCGWSDGATTGRFEGTVGKGMVGEDVGASWVETSACRNCWRDATQSERVAESSLLWFSAAEVSRCVRERS